MVDAQIQQLIDLISRVRVNIIKGIPSPHKYIFLLSLIKVYEKGVFTENKFPLNLTLESIFKKTWLELLPDSNPNEIFIEYPFFYLINDGIWQLKVIPEKQPLYDKYLKTKKRLTKKRLIETVQYGFLDSEFHKAFSNKVLRKKIASKLHSLLKSNEYQIIETHDRVEESASLYAHEATAINQIKDAVKSRQLGYVCSNIDLHDPQSNRYFEIDLFIACPFGLYVVELKHWTGKIKVLPYSWSVNGFSRSDPHKANNHKAKLIRGICERKFSYLNIPFAESVVTLTHPEAITEGCSNPGTAKNQPTFDGIGRLVDYLKNQKTKKTSLISKDDAKGICNFIGDLHKPGLAKDIQFPGYEIVERLYQAEDRAEFITRPTHLGNRSMTRLRIFFNAGYDRGTGVDHTQIEKARATLNTIAKMKDHPNLLRVLALPNQEGHLIEASDWSEQGTLQDLIALNSSLEMELSLAVITGILKGLEAIHERGVVHRNLCPENILMVENTPKLMNFDLSYQLENRNLTVIPDPSSLKRSPYIAPEIYDLGEDLAENADLFSVGVLLYQMLTGEVPFKCSLDLGQTNGHLSPAGVDQLKKTNVPQKMIDLIQCLIQSEPMHRPASVRVVLEALAPFSPFKGMGMNAELNPGDMHEQFKIIKFIKKGADSQIYKALGPMGQQLFLKLFNIDVPQKRIIREKQMSTAVSHGSIVKAQYCQPWKDRRYLLAFNWIDGIPIHGPGRQELPEPDIFNQVASTLLKALEGLHSYEEEDELNPVLHNDIKPDNILLTDEMRPMLIDFGIASHPEIGLYSGSTGYVSPDSILGEDRNYSIQGDLFGLGVTLFEWFFGKKPYDRLILDAKVVDMHSLRLGLESSLEQWFLKAVAVKAEDRFESAAQMYEDLQIALGVAEDSSKEKEAGKIEMPGEDKYTAIDGEEPEGISIYPMPEMGPNPFVAYLNTLHNRDAANGNALAESQACNEWFGHIQVEHPLTGKIMDKLLMQGHHVILTGHAGDGKSTIGLEVYKRLKNLPTQNKLDRELKPREDVEADGASISIIKDFSEWDDEAKIQLIDQAGEKGAPTILLISNTGTLLDAFHKLDDQQGRSRLEMENDLLKVFSQSRPAPVIHNGVSYFVINLAMFDNLVLARTIFERMVCKDRWEECLSCEKSEKCTINRNVRLLQENPIAIDRIFFLYRRMFEYKDRFTLRQLIAHMAYMITAGMEYADILNYASAPEPPRMTEFMFFNRFFGDSGRHPDKPARQMQIIRTLIDRELGQKPCPSWERRLWLSDPQSDFKLCVKGLSSDFDRLRRIGGGVKISDIYSGETGKKSARQQVRRILFFLQKFSADEKAGNIYLSCFLNSPMLLPLLKWRVAPKKFSTTEEQHLRQQVMHVLQEQFAGIRLPEQESGLKQLYITLNRNDREMRQATQVVLADFASKDFKIEWEKNTTGEGIAPSLIFSGTGPYEDATLNLALPFLDYVRMRQQGETGQDLQTSFSDRIEYFKAQLIRINPSDRSANDMVLLRLQTNHRFREYRVIVADNKLEVINA